MSGHKWRARRPSCPTRPHRPPGHAIRQRRRPPAPHLRAAVSVEAIRGYLDTAKDLGIGDAGSASALLVDLSNKVHPLVLGQIFRTREQIRFLAQKLLKRQIPDGEKTQRIIDFLCAESGSHDYTINRREAVEMGLRVEKPSDELYGLLRQVHQSYVNELKLLEPYDPYSMLGEQPFTNYALPRVAIESAATGSHKFFSEGVLSRAANPAMPPGMMQPGVVMQDTVHDHRKFEGWRKTA